MRNDAFKWFDEDFDPPFLFGDESHSPFRFVNDGHDIRLLFGIENESLTRNMRMKGALSNSAYQEALDAFSDAFTLNPTDDDEEEYRSGETLIHEAQFERALEVFLMLSLQRAEDPRPHYLAGYCYSRMNRPQEAIRCLRLAKKLAAKDPDGGMIEESIVHLLREFGEG